MVVVRRQCLEVATTVPGWRACASEVWYSRGGGGGIEVVSSNPHHISILLDATVSLSRLRCQVVRAARGARPPSKETIAVPLNTQPREAPVSLFISLPFISLLIT